MNTLVQQETGNRYTLIHPSLEMGFEIEMMCAYEDYMKKLKAPAMTDADNIVSEVFVPAYQFGLLSYWRRENPEELWDHATNEDLDQVEEEQVLGHPWEFDELLYDDVMAMIDIYNIFFIETPVIFHPISQKTEYLASTFHNPPLQEVW